MIFAPASQGKRFFPEPDERLQAGAALRLQPQETAGRLQNGSLPLPVSAEKKIKAGSELNPKRFEAPKIPKPKFSEHVQPFMVGTARCAVRNEF
jgi:hypothetical protein